MAEEPIPNADDTTAQVAKLREQVEALMNERVTPVLADAADRAESAMGAVRGQAEAMSGRVKDQPFAAVLIAAAVGFLVGRVLR
jgi:ElaB/YqjD/DUF883 family membrane-anchored ribosome-binding protein